MKGLIAFIVVSLICGVAYGVDLQLGAEVDVVLDRDVNLQNSGVEADYTAQYYDVTLESKIGSVTLTPKAGIQTLQLSGDVFGTDVDLNSGIGWNVGIDGQMDVYSCKYVDVALIGSYRFSRTDIDEVEIGALSIDNPIETITYLHEYELGVQVSKDLRAWNVPLTPSLGLVYSDMRGDIDVNLSVIDLDEEIEADKNIGVRLGLEAEGS
jgi:hypothetical protein